MIMNYTNGRPAFDFEIITPDMVMWERYARQSKLPVSQSAPDFPQFTFAAFVSYSAARRVGNIPADMSFDTYLEDCAMPAPSAGEDSEEMADPT
jgi:hypothetical protein